MRVRSVFFDLDGTLWAPHSVVLPAFRQVFDRLGWSVPDDATLLDTLGYQNEVIWQRLLPGAGAAARQQADQLMAEAELELIRSGVGRPFPQVDETLAALAGAGCSLYILSNCGSGYLQAVPDALGIGRHFSDRFCAGDFPGLTKSQILTRVLPTAPQPAAMVGDRWHDIAAGVENGLLTIGCCFGVGQSTELDQADYRIRSFAELWPILAGSSDAQ